MKSLHTTLLFTVLFLGLDCAISLAEGASLTELTFNEFFETPIGSRGLVLTEKLRSLNGKEVRITGYPVLQEKSGSEMFLLTAMPVQLHDEHSGLADDLPAATVFVLVGSSKGVQPRQRIGKIEVSGVLTIGSREEADGRISLIRINANKITGVAQTRIGTGHY